MSKAEKPEDLKIDWNAIDLMVERDGEKIVLPAKPGPMTYKEARIALKRIEEAENTEFTIAEKVDCHFYDGLVAFAKALKFKYGYSMAQPTPGFFGPKPPRFVHVKTGPKTSDFVQVPFGSFSIPNIDGVIQTQAGMSRGIPVLVIGGTVMAKEKHIVMELVALTKQFSKQESIYQGRSIILEKDEKKDGINFDEPLLFFDPYEGHEVPIFNTETEDLINVAIKAPIINAKACRNMNIPLKRGILLEGPYGTGKTLTAREVAKTANDHKWTFILVSKAAALSYALTFARMYQPCVVFAEDIDRMVEERNEGANDLINQIDGVVGKNDEIITVLTTNFAEKIDKSMLRPGRLDAVVAIRPPETEAVKKLVRFYAGPLLNDKDDLTPAAEKLAGNIPATIREVVERSKLSMLFRGDTHISVDDLSVAADGMKNHLELIENAREGKREMPSIEESIGKVVLARAEEAATKALERCGFDPHEND